MHVRISSALLFSAVLMGCATPRQLNYDADVDRLCALDGGVVVNETVELPSSAFDKYGFPKFATFTAGKSDLGPDYAIQQEFNIIAGSPASSGPYITKRVYGISRKADGHLLGRWVHYARVGGDIAGTTLLPSGHECARPKQDLIKMIFKKELK